MMGTAWPSERTRRSAAGFQTSLGSQRMWLYMSTAVRWARERAVEGWPEPAAVVISTDSLPSLMAFLCMEDAKLMMIPYLLCERDGSPPGRRKNVPRARGRRYENAA